MKINLPTTLTLLRIFLIPIFIIMFLLKSYILAAVFFSILSATDFLDGMLARKLNQCTPLGAFLDPIADKVLVISAMFLLCGFVKDFNIQCVILFSVCVARDQIISGFRLFAESKQKTVKVDKLGKAKTAILNIALIILIVGMLNKFVLLCGLILTYVGTILSVISGVNYVSKNLDVLK